MAEIKWFSDLYNRNYNGAIGIEGKGDLALSGNTNWIIDSPSISIKNDYKQDSSFMGDFSKQIAETANALRDLWNGIEQAGRALENIFGKDKDGNTENSNSGTNWYAMSNSDFTRTFANTSVSVSSITATKIVPYLKVGDKDPVDKCIEFSKQYLLGEVKKHAGGLNITVHAPNNFNMIDAHSAVDNMMEGLPSPGTWYIKLRTGKPIRNLLCTGADIKLSEQYFRSGKPTGSGAVNMWCSITLSFEPARPYFSKDVDTGILLHGSTENKGENK